MAGNGRGWEEPGQAGNIELSRGSPWGPGFEIVAQAADFELWIPETGQNSARERVSHPHVSISHVSQCPTPMCPTPMCRTLGMDRFEATMNEMMNTMNERFAHLTACMVKSGTIRGDYR